MTANQHIPDDADQRVAALMMAAGGLKPADIARHLGLHEQQVRDWLAMTRHDERNEDGPDAA